MTLISILALSAIAQLLPAQFAVAEQRLRGEQNSVTQSQTNLTRVDHHPTNINPERFRRRANAPKASGSSGLSDGRRSTSVKSFRSGNSKASISDAGSKGGGSDGRASELPNPKVFEAAISLDDFKNVDPKLFEWVNPDEIQPGETTCGFLKAPLGWVDETDIKYPFVKTYVCVTFASQQPATRGNLAVHCGGPGSLSSCGLILSLHHFDDETSSTFNIIAFDQRGMGRSKPTFVVEECAVESREKSFVNYDDEESIRKMAKVYKKEHLRCWKYPDFQLKATQGDSSTRYFHFLEYSGTRQLAEDIERVRLLFGNQKLSIYGISYGTTVMGTYATVFSKNVNLMVLDANTDPSNDIESQSLSSARSSQQRLDYFIASCEFGNFDCGVPDLRTCIDDVNTILDWIEHNDPAYDLPYPLIWIVWRLIGHYDLLEGLCEIAKDRNVDAFNNWVSENNVFRDEEEAPAPEAPTSVLYNSPSKPTYMDAMNPNHLNWPFEGYRNLVGTSSVTQDMIWAQDNAFGAYDEDRYVHFLQKINQDYPGEGTQMPVRAAQQWYSATYFWPNITPLPPMGNPFLSGIIAGQLFDPATPYEHTQKMREHFKSATLLTSRSVNHGLNVARDSHLTVDQRCLSNIFRYLKNGEIDFTDGKVCESKGALTGCTIDGILTGQKCLKKNIKTASPLLAGWGWEGKFA